MSEWGSREAEYQAPGLAVRALIGALAFAGLLLAGFLLYGALERTSLAGCGPGSGCDQVLASSWSKVRGVPVALPAFILYCAMAVAAMCIGPGLPLRICRVAWITLLCSMVMVVAAAWFLVVQIAMVGAMCKYCLTTHGIGVVLCGLVLFAAPIRKGKTGSAARGSRTLISGTVVAAVAVVALAAVGALAAIQVLAPSSTMQLVQLDDVGPMEGENNEVPDTVAQIPDSDDPGPDSNGGSDDPAATTQPVPMPDRRFFIAKGVKISMRDHPVDGPPDSKAMMVLMYDYTCSHCRRFHKSLAAARKRYGEQFAIVMMPVPLGKQCNKHVEKNYEAHKYSCALARLAHAVWLADPSKFRQYDNWVFKPRQAPPAYRAREQAERLVGAESLKNALADPWPLEQIKHNVELHHQAGKGLPIFIVGRTKMMGFSETEKDLFKMIESQTRLRPKTTY